MLYIGLDIGTTGSKAMAINLDGQVKAFASGEYETIRMNLGWAEIDPRQVWQTVKNIIKQVTAKAGETISAISITSLGESFILLDYKDQVLSNSMLFADIRGTEEIKDILDKINTQELFDLTGMPINSMYTLNKWLWMQKHNPEILDKAQKMFLFGDYIGYMLSGERYIDYSLASRTLLLDHNRKGWSDRILNLFGIDKRQLSTPVRSGKMIGKISSTLANELGLHVDTLLVAGGHDQVCAALGAGVLRNGQCVDGIGTSECITTMIDNVANGQFMRENNYCLEPYVTNGKYVTLAFNTTGASLLRWYRDTFEMHLVRQSLPSNQSVYGLMESECPSEPTSLFVLPHFAGSGTPYMDAHASGAILGLRLATTKSEIYKACMEGLCFEMRFNTEMLSEMGIHLTGMTCVGGGAHSDLLLQIKADIMGVPIGRLHGEESGTYGLAMLCATACNEASTLEEAAAMLVKNEKTFYPDKNRNKIYNDKFEHYKNFSQKVKRIN